MSLQLERRVNLGLPPGQLEGEKHTPAVRIEQVSIFCTGVYRFKVPFISLKNIVFCWEFHNIKLS